MSGLFHSRADCTASGGSKLQTYWNKRDRTTVYPHIQGGYIPSPPTNAENPWIVDAVLKSLCMMIYKLKYASQTHSKDSLTH